MLTIPLLPQANKPMYEQIYEYIKQEIQKGNLTYKTKLPSSRALASHLQISRTTVDFAYGQLLAEGYVDSYPKKGYYVSQVQNLASQNRPVQGPQTAPEKQGKKKILTDFSPFTVDLTHFPYRTWKNLSRNCLNEQSDLFLLGENQGEEAFREAIANYVRFSRTVQCSKEQIIIGAGADYLLQLLTLLLPRDFTLAMENPSYKQAYHIFHGLGIKTRAISLDPSGMNIEALKKSDATIAYVTPSHQYPLGIVMPISRRIKLLEWASERKNRFIIEDDHDSEFRYRGKPIPSLQGIDSHQKIIYIGTFSKAIAPAIRVGYLILPPALLEIYQKQYSYYASTVSRIDQAILTEFLNQGYFERHVNRMRKRYKEKHDFFLQCIKPFGKKIKIYGENAGLHFVMEVQTKRSEQELLFMADQAAIKLYGLSQYYITPPVRSPFQAGSYAPSFLMGYANLSKEEIQSGLETLFSCWEKHQIFS